MVADLGHGGGGDRLRLSGDDRANPGLTKTPGNAPSVDEVVNSTTANSGNCFRYDSVVHQFVFNLWTKESPAPSLYALRARIVGPDGAVLASHVLGIGPR